MAVLLEGAALPKPDVCTKSPEASENPLQLEAVMIGILYKLTARTAQSRATQARKPRNCLTTSTFCPDASRLSMCSTSHARVILCCCPSHVPTGGEDSGHRATKRAAPCQVTAVQPHSWINCASGKRCTGLFSLGLFTRTHQAL